MSLNKMFLIQIIRLLQQTREGCCWRKLIKSLKRLRNYLIRWIEKGKGKFEHVSVVNCPTEHRNLLTMVSKQKNDSSEIDDEHYEYDLQEFMLSKALEKYLHDIFLIDFLTTQCIFDNIDNYMFAKEDDTIPVTPESTDCGNIQETRLTDRLCEKISKENLSSSYTEKKMQKKNNSSDASKTAAYDMRTTISPLLSFLLQYPSPLVISEMAHPSSLHDFEDEGQEQNESFITEKNVSWWHDIKIKNDETLKLTEQSQTIKYLTTRRDPIFFGFSVIQVFDVPNFINNNDLFTNNPDSMDNETFAVELSPELEVESDEAVNEIMEDVMNQILVVCDTYFSDLSSVQFEIAADNSNLEQQNDTNDTLHVIDEVEVIAPFLDIFTGHDSDEEELQDSNIADDGKQIDVPEPTEEPNNKE